MAFSIAKEIEKRQNLIQNHDDNMVKVQELREQAKVLEIQALELENKYVGYSEEEIVNEINELKVIGKQIQYCVDTGIQFVSDETNNESGTQEEVPTL